MNGRRPLAELLTELADSVVALSAPGGPPVRAHTLSLRLPIDLRLVSTDGGPQVIGDVPLFRTRTEFDPDPAHVEITWCSGPPEAGAPS